jgi:hypothetical protein
MVWESLLRSPAIGWRSSNVMSPHRLARVEGLPPSRTLTFGAAK